MLHKLLKESVYTVVLTGAGMSTESGLSDFRSFQKGLWKHKNPQQIASTYALQHNRTEFIDFYKMRIAALQNCEPHQGHHILAKWEEEGNIQSIITQNVDGFHHQAGSKRVAELHGTLRHIRCQRCHTQYENNLYLLNQYECKCGGFLRPSVVLFGETLPYEAIIEAEKESNQADLFIVLGSSLQVAPANHFPIEAKHTGAKLVIINMEPTDFDEEADIVIQGRQIGEVLKEVDEALHC
ncbi:NAD-dependent deacylase [Metabacillus iocasae]|uniref:protein acetyllysine N-acetyltransferase n=1 Tax=Priestia iocasae TaxID=2291674 RepID=A0ABS2QWD9_9BACI|nr:NAD-dependent deacylase [Metabacillus iocasae]MBM7703795.1 NAD-dependent deacetylase [Metabacillus iocasae]